MGTSAEEPGSQVDRPWFIVGRWQEYEGEARANVLRILAIGAFYVVELINYHGLRLGAVEFPPVSGRWFHQIATALAVVWVLGALAILLGLRQRFFPASLKYLSTGMDLLLLTGLLMIANGPRSPLVVGYLLLVVLATLRFSLALVWFATAGAVAGYLFLIGYARWGIPQDLGVPRYHELIFLLSLILTGIVLGQVIRRVRDLAKDYAARVEAEKGGPT
jgi:hypothetical protein